MSVGLLVVRADGGAGIGSGHLSRGLALAQAWRDAGGEARLVTASTPALWTDLYRAEGADVVDPVPGWERSGAAWTALDGYQFGLDDQERVRNDGGRLLVVDDHGTVGRYAADVVLDQNLGASAEDYRGRAPHTALLLGPTYALLRREFRRITSRDTAWEVERVLVSLGGDPPEDAVQRVRQGLALVPGFEVEWLPSGREVAEAMAAADLAVSGGGVTTWELCAMGVPSVLLVLAANQRPVADAVAGAGAAISAGDYAGVEPKDLARVLADLAADPVARHRMADTGRRLVDGRGARRVVAGLLAVLLDVRLAEPSDVHRLWEWAKDPTVRSSAFDDTEISWEDHVAWFAAKSASPKSRIYITELHGRAIGQVRFDIEASEAEIDVSLAAAERGRGLGASVIRAAARRFFDETHVALTVARVRAENRASALAFVDAGFEPDGEGWTGSNHWLRYALGRDDGGR
jgi:spore coat polysaccharide biosynthesis predicted glycosyltransferase SpsG